MVSLADLSDYYLPLLLVSFLFVVSLFDMYTAYNRHQSMSVLNASSSTNQHRKYSILGPSRDYKPATHADSCFLLLCSLFKLIASLDFVPHSVPSNPFEECCGIVLLFIWPVIRVTQYGSLCCFGLLLVTSYCSYWTYQFIVWIVRHVFQVFGRSKGIPAVPPPLSMTDPGRVRKTQCENADGTGGIIIDPPSFKKSDNVNHWDLKKKRISPLFTSGNLNYRMGRNKLAMVKKNHDMRAQQSIVACSSLNSSATNNRFTAPHYTSSNVVSHTYYNRVEGKLPQYSSTTFQRLPRYRPAASSRSSVASVNQPVTNDAHAYVAQTILDTRGSHFNGSRHETQPICQSFSHQVPVIQRLVSFAPYSANHLVSHSIPNAILDPATVFTEAACKKPNESYHNNGQLMCLTGQNVSAQDRSDTVSQYPLPSQTDGTAPKEPLMKNHIPGLDSFHQAAAITQSVFSTASHSGNEQVSRPAQCPLSNVVNTQSVSAHLPCTGSFGIHDQGQLMYSSDQSVTVEQPTACFPVTLFNVASHRSLQSIQSNGQPIGHLNTTHNKNQPKSEIIQASHNVDRLNQTFRVYRESTIRQIQPETHDYVLQQQADVVNEAYEPPTCSQNPFKPCPVSILPTRLGGLSLADKTHATTSISGGGSLDDLMDVDTDPVVQESNTVGGSNEHMDIDEVVNNLNQEASNPCLQIATLTDMMDMDEPTMVTAPPTEGMDLDQPTHVISAHPPIRPKMGPIKTVPLVKKEAHHPFLPPCPPRAPKKDPMLRKIKYQKYLPTRNCNMASGSRKLVSLPLVS